MSRVESSVQETGVSPKARERDPGTMSVARVSFPTVAVEVSASLSAIRYAGPSTYLRRASSVAL